MRVWTARILASVMVVPLAGCGGSDTSKFGQTAPAPSAFGYAVADEPQAAVIARQILSQGGNAADAATAAGFALAVTLPSRAGLGGGGECVIKMPTPQGKQSAAIVLSFPPGAPSAAGGSRPAAVPGLARGLLALQARYGSLPFSTDITPAERLAGGGVPVSPALESDLQVVGTALLSDPAAASVFGPSGTVLPTGATLIQSDLAATLEVLRTQGVPGFYQGSFAGKFATAATVAGGTLQATDLAAFRPQYIAPQLAESGSYEVANIPSQASATAGALPASAGFAALDKNGGVVACATTMDNLFGTGRIAAGTGILLAASPRSVPTPDLAAAVAYAAGGATFRAAVTGTGQTGAANAVAIGMANALQNNLAATVPEPGRANIISCPGGVPGAEGSCQAGADPRGQGLALGGR